MQYHKSQNNWDYRSNLVHFILYKSCQNMHTVSNRFPLSFSCPSLPSPSPTSQHWEYPDFSRYFEAFKPYQTTTRPNFGADLDPAFSWLGPGPLDLANMAAVSRSVMTSHVNSRQELRLAQKLGPRAAYYAPVASPVKDTTTSWAEFVPLLSPKNTSENCRSWRNCRLVRRLCVVKIRVEGEGGESWQGIG